MEMGEVTQRNKQEKLREYYEGRQVGETEKVEEISKKVTFKDRNKNN